MGGMFFAEEVRGDVTQVDVEPGFNQGNEIAAGEFYYAVGHTYNFDVRVRTYVVDFSSLTDVRLTIPSGNPKTSSDIVIRVDASVASGSATIVSGGGSATFTRGPNSADFIVTISYTVTATSVETPRDLGILTARAESTLGGGVVNATITQNHTYGIVRSAIMQVDVESGFNQGNEIAAGEFYYAVGHTYNFDVRVRTYVVDFSSLTDVRLTIPSGNPKTSSDIVIRVDASVASGSATIVSGGGSATFTRGANPTDFIVTISYTVTVSTVETPYTAGVLNASAESTYRAGFVVNATTIQNHTYGITRSARVVISQFGDAIDNLVNPWHGAFDITGDIVYAVPGAIPGTDNVDESIITQDPVLVYEYNSSAIDTDTTIIDNNNDGDGLRSTLEFNVPADWFYNNALPDDGIGSYTWKVRTTILGIPSQVLLADPPLDILCDKIEIIGMSFHNGGGLDNPPDYHRNIYTAGTQIQVLAQMQYGGGNTTVDAYIDVEYNYGGGVQTTTVIIPAGTNGSAVWYEIKNPTSVDVPTGTTLGPFSDYFITSVTGAGGIFGGDGQNVAGRFTHTGYTPPSIHWDNADPPGDDGSNMFTPWISTTSTVNAITLNWTPLDPAANPVFSSYRIYYKPVLAQAWNMIDENTDSPTTDSLGQISTGTYTITGLQSITEYEYYLTAIDIYGNETLSANRAHAGTPGDLSHTVTTAAYGLEISVTDGITLYDNTAMENDNTNPAIRPLLATSIRFEVDISGADQPGEINVIIANTTADGFDSNPPNDGVFDLHPDIENEVSASWDKPAAPDGFFRIPISKVAPNKWAGHISSENPLIVPANNCKFILEVLQGTTPSYYGFDPDQNMNDVQWTFSIIDPPKVTPWPTRILNNVITSKNPVAYPAYYLTDDAYVTIIAYDIKGRPVATLLDNAFRRSGQNIREQGWRGTNKAGRKLGVGLYYVHIKAKRVSDGKTIINKFEKVVMAR